MLFRFWGLLHLVVSMSYVILHELAVILLDYTVCSGLSLRS